MTIKASDNSVKFSLAEDTILIFCRLIVKIQF